MNAPPSPQLIARFRLDITVPGEVVDGNRHVNNVAYVQWMQDAALAQLLRVVEEQVHEVPADDAGGHRPDREIPQRRLVQPPAACASEEQRRRERDACRRENAEGLDGDRPDLQRGDDEVRDQATTRTLKVMPQA